MAWRWGGGSVQHLHPGSLPPRGFGLVLTLQPLLDARAAGHTVAVLQAATQGVRIYERIGFQAFGGTTEYKPTALQKVMF